MRKFLKKIVDKVADVLDERSATKETIPEDPLDDVVLPSWKTEIVEHPQYWIEVNYEKAPEKGSLRERLRGRQAQELPPPVDVKRVIHEQATMLVFQTVRHQLKRHIAETEANWVAEVKNSRLHVELEMTTEASLSQFQQACNVAMEIVRSHGIMMNNFPVGVKEVEGKKHALVDVSIASFKFDVNTPLVWIVLQRNKENPIIWEGQLWLPK